MVKHCIKIVFTHLCYDDKDRDKRTDKDRDNAVVKVQVAKSVRGKLKLVSLCCRKLKIYNKLVSLTKKNTFIYIYITSSPDANK